MERIENLFRVGFFLDSIKNNDYGYEMLSELSKKLRKGYENWNHLMKNFNEGNDIECRDILTDDYRLFRLFNKIGYSQYKFFNDSCFVIFTSDYYRKYDITGKIIDQETFTPSLNLFLHSP